MPLKTYLIKDFDRFFNPFSVDGYVSRDPNFWISRHVSIVSQQQLVLMNGHEDDHAIASNIGFDIGIADLRNQLRTQIDSRLIQTLVLSKDNDLDYDKVVGIETNEDLINRILVELINPSHCRISFDNDPRPSGTFADDFTGTDGQLLENRTGWTKAVDGLYDAEIDTNELALRTGTGSGDSVWICTDQGSADHYVQAYDVRFASETLVYLCARLVDEDNFIAYHLAGTGGAGARLCKNVSGSLTDSIVTTQGGDGYGFKIECDGNTIRFYRDTGGGFAQVGSDQTISDHNTETSAGFVAGDATGPAKWDDFENGTLAVTTAPPTTIAPTTTAPTTAAPTTLAPTTTAPTTLAPTTAAPTTIAPTTLAPTTIAPTTIAPTTLEPTTLEPTTIAPTTIGPTTQPPTTLAPTTLTPTTTLTTAPPPEVERRGFNRMGLSLRSGWR